MRSTQPGGPAAWLRANLFSGLYPTRNDSALRRAHRAHVWMFELFIVAWTVSLAWSWADYALRNTVVVLPLGMARLIPVEPLFAHPWPHVLAAAVTAACAAGLLGRWWNRDRDSSSAWMRGLGAVGRWGYAVALGGLHLLYVVRFSQGEIPHSANLVGIGLAGLALGSAAFGAGERRDRFVVGFVLFFTGLGYTSAAVSKLVGTGLGWPAGEHLVLWIAEKATDVVSRTGSWEPNALQRAVLWDARVGTAVLLVGWLTEWAGVLLWVPRLRPWVTTMLLGMHMGITAAMNIVFLAFVMQLLLLGYPWGAWGVRLARGWRGFGLRAGASPLKKAAWDGGWRDEKARVGRWRVGSRRRS